jgi:sirohydrochlorin ferrochelatase
MRRVEQTIGAAAGLSPTIVLMSTRPATHDAPTVAVLLIAHGSRRAEANDDLVALARRIEAMGAYPVAVASFLELAEPSIEAGGAACVERGATRVLMVPYLLAAGVHLRRDLTASREALARRFPKVTFILGPSLGPHPLLDQLVLERARETADKQGEEPTSALA